MRVEHIVHSGDDLLVVNAARASFGKESSYGETLDLRTKALEKIKAETSSTALKKMARYIDYLDRNAEAEIVYSLQYADFNLLDYLAREKHVLPFRHPQITLRCKAPIFLARQLGKHQVGMSWSEESRRYITTEPEFFWPDKWRKKADNVKQGSSDEEVTTLFDDSNWTPQLVTKDALDAAVGAYRALLDGGVAPELARMILPQNMMVTWVWTGSLLSFYQLYKLRAEAHAQKEARDFAEMIKEKVSEHYPESWAALEAHV